MMFRFIVIAVVIVVTGSVNFVASRNETCDRSQDFSCGNFISSIHYPFWPMIDHGQYPGSTPETCGYPGFGISCIHSIPVLNISNVLYNVLVFSENSITVIDRELAGQTCPRPHRNFTLGGATSGFKFPLLDSQNLTLFFNCTSPPPRVPPPVLFPVVPNNSLQHFACLDYNSRLRSYGIIGDVTNPKLLDWRFGNCKEKSMVVPVMLSNNDNVTDYIQTLQRGFVLYWNKPVGCDHCENSGGSCLYNDVKNSKGSNFSCVCPNGERGSHVCSNRMSNINLDSGSTQVKILIIAVCSVAGGLAFVVSLCRQLLWFWEGRGSTTEKVEIAIGNQEFLSVQRYRYEYIKKMTRSFRDRLGQGGYGSVFKGKLVDGRLVAVKVLTNDPRKSNGDEFINELATIGRTNHINIVTLLGFCSSGPKRALVYELMPNGSLEKFIHTSKETTPTTTDATTINAKNHTLGWEKLHEIAIGIARGLEYLHEGCNTGRILHFDIKPHNILLDENLYPKISDFGLAKLYPTRDHTVSMDGGGRGTLGYIAPELYSRNIGEISTSADVYSYGMVVLEMVGGRKNIDPFVQNTSEIYFPHWIYDHLDEQGNNVGGILEIEQVVEEEMAKKMIMVGLSCIQLDPTNRPSMSKVVGMLEGTIPFTKPQKPELVGSSSSSSTLPPPPPPPPLVS